MTNRRRLFDAVLTLMLTAWFAYALSQQGFQGDLLMDIANGRWILAHGTIPLANVLTVAQHGARWAQDEWLFGVCVAWAYAWGGRLAIFLVFLPLLLILAYQIVRLLRPVGAMWSVIIAVVVAVSMQPYIEPRPQVFSYIFFTFGIWAVWRARKMPSQEAPYWHRMWPVWALAFSPVLWVQLHASAYLTTALLIGAAIFALNSRDQTTYLLAGVVSLVVSFLHPGGLSGGASFLGEIFSPGVLNYISEWMSPNMHSYPGVLMLLWAAFVGLIAAHWSLERRDYMAFAWVALGMAASLFALRFTPYMVLLVVPIVASYLPEKAQVSARMVIPATVMTAVAAIGMLAMVMVTPLFPNREPMAAVRYVNTHRAGSVFAWYDMGDVFDLYGPPAWVDGRAELWVAQPWWKAYVGVTVGDGNLPAFIAKHDPTAAYVVWPLGTNGERQLLSAGWHIVEQSSDSLPSVSARVGVFAQGKVN